MFTGYGGAEWSLKQAGIPFEIVGYSEIDKNAIKCYNQNFHGIKNFGDCSKIDVNDLPDFDLLTGGFPCQDVSIAGKRDLSVGRTMLVNHIFRIAKVKKPKYMLLENVKGILSTPLHKSIIHTLEKLGYGVIVHVLNTKDYSIPQNRERVFYICKFGGWKFMEFLPPKKTGCPPLRTILEENVDEKYYLSEKLIKNLIKYNKRQEENGRGLVGGTGVDVLIADFQSDKGLSIRKNGVSPTLKASNHGDIYNCPLLIPCLTPDRIEKRQNRRRFKENNDSMFTLNTQDRHGILLKDMKIRRLTPTECFRLQGFLNDEINLEGLSDSTKYKLAGNGWSINVVSLIFKKMFKK